MNRIDILDNLDRILYTLFSLFLLCFLARAQIKTDSVYLLDVTSSMVGREAGAKDILNEVLDMLLADIDRHGPGRIILITFADGPYDLDGLGPIQAQYRIEINSESDKLFLKQFLRPTQYGSFSENPNWPGVYEAVRRAHGIGPTAIYKTILLALETLETIQNETGPEYRMTHAQELVVYTDGRNNAPGSPSFEEVVQRLKERHFQMAGRFRYKRYLFSTKPEDIRQAQQECAILDRERITGYAQNVVAPDPSRLIVLDFDRDVIVFPNLWAPSTAAEDTIKVVVRNVELRYDATKAPWLQNMRLVLRPLKATDLGLPSEITIKLRTIPEEVRLPIKSFDIEVTFTPASRFKAFMDQKNYNDLSGFLYFELVKNEGGAASSCNIAPTREPLVDLKQPSILVIFPFIRPMVTVHWSIRPGEAFDIKFVPNDVFQSLKVEQRKIYIEYNEKHFALRDEQGRFYSSGEQIPLPGLKFFFLQPTEALSPGVYRGVVKFVAEFQEVRINAAPIFIKEYEFRVLGFDRAWLVFPNLYCFPKPQESKRAVTAEIRLQGELLEQGTILIKPINFSFTKAGVGINLEPCYLKLPLQSNNILLTLELTSFDLLANSFELQSAINKTSQDGQLYFEFSGSPEHLVKFNPPYLPVDLFYIRPMLMVTVNGTEFMDIVADLGDLRQGQRALILELKPNEAFRSLPTEEQLIRLHFNPTHFSVTDAFGQALLGNDFNPISISTLVFQPSPLVERDKTLEGEVLLISRSQDILIHGNEGSVVIKYKFRCPSCRVSLTSTRTDVQLEWITRNMFVTDFIIVSNEACMEKKHILRVEYDSIFMIFDENGKLVQSGQDLNPEQRKLKLHISSNLKKGLAPRELLCSVRFTAYGEVTLDGKQTETFFYNLRIGSVLAGPLYGLSIGSFVLAFFVFFVPVAVYCVIEKVDPLTSLVELKGKYGTKIMFGTPLIFVVTGFLALLGYIFLK